ncbi:MAG: M16 family metallopeptidase [Moraxellaceae bacterium]
MRRLWWLALVLPLAAQASPQRSVQPGPVTALANLESVPAADAVPPARRAFAIERWQTANGARVLFVAADELPMLDVRLVFDAGAARDDGAGGLASTVASLLNQGTATRDTSAIAEAFEQVGAQFSASSHRDMAVVEMRVLAAPEFRDPALAVFADVVARPAFPEDSFLRIQRSAEVGQQQQEQSPSALASRLFFQELYGRHPYATPPRGTRESLARLSREQVQAFHARYYVARNLTIALVGQLSRAEAEAVAEQLSAALPAGEPAPALPAARPPSKRRQVHRSFPSAQTHLLVGTTGIRRGDPDHYALVVGNEILGGGGFTSLLTRELRQKRGLTYGVSSGFTPMRAQGPFIVSLSTRHDQAGEALTLLLGLLGDFLRTGPDEAAVREAKASIVAGFPMTASSNAAIVGHLGAIGFYDLPLDYLDQYLARIEAVTPADVRRAFRRHVDPARLLVVSVGQGKP